MMDRSDAKLNVMEDALFSSSICIFNVSAEFSTTFVKLFTIISRNIDFRHTIYMSYIMFIFIVNTSGTCSGTLRYSYL